MRQEGLAIHHVAMRTLDVPRLERFYVDALGFPVALRNPDRGSVWLRAGVAVLMLERASPGEPTVAPATRELLAFAVPPTDGWKGAWRTRLQGAGAPVEGETEHTLYFRDPDGRRLAVSTYPL